MSSTVHIIGAGVAGLSAALALSAQGRNITLYESAPQAGGRCRSFYDATLNTTLDNGNHLLLGANRAAIAYTQRIGTWDSHFTSMDYFTFMDVRTRQPWHCRPPFSFPGITLRQWWHVLALFTAKPHHTVADCMSETTPLYQRIILPLCVAALNTHPHDASAKMLGHVLRRLLLGGPHAWQAYIPNKPLNACFIDPAIHKIQTHGGKIHYGCTIRQLEHSDQRISALIMADSSVTVRERDAVIIATPPSSAHKLLPHHVNKLDTRPIINAHFLWPKAQAGKPSVLGVLNGLAEWIFIHQGRISTTTSAATANINDDDEALARRIWNEICTALMLNNATLPPYRIIREKRATFASTPANLLKLPKPQLLQNMRLAGDYLNPTMPATLDTAIQSGMNAAHCILKS